MNNKEEQQVPDGIVAFVFNGDILRFDGQDKSKIDYFPDYKPWVLYHMGGSAPSTIHIISVHGKEWSVGDDEEVYGKVESFEYDYEDQRWLMKTNCATLNVSKCEHKLPPQSQPQFVKYRHFDRLLHPGKYGEQSPLPEQTEAILDFHKESNELLQEAVDELNEYKEADEDHKKLIREIDEILNGKEGMAKQASLCDLVGQIKVLKDRSLKSVPIWVKASERLPKPGTECYCRVLGAMKRVIYYDHTPHWIDYENTSYHNNRVEWLDESAESSEIELRECLMEFVAMEFELFDESAPDAETYDTWRSSKLTDLFAKAKQLLNLQ